MFMFRRSRYHFWSRSGLLMLFLLSWTAQAQAQCGWARRAVAGMGMIVLRVQDGRGHSLYRKIWLQ